MINNNLKFPAGVLRRYKDENAFLVKDDLGEGDGYRVIRADLLSASVVQKAKGDSLKRSIIRHDPQKIAKELLKLMD